MSTTPKFCPQCGRPLADRVRFCAGCGTAVPGTANVEPQTVAPARGAGDPIGVPAQSGVSSAGVGAERRTHMTESTEHTSAGTAGAGGGTGLAPNVAGALSYLLGLVTGVAFLLTEKDGFVRFHAFQSILASVAWIGVWFVFFILQAIVVAIPGLGVLAALLAVLVTVGLYLLGLVLWIVLMVKAYRGERWQLPYIGAMAERYAASQVARAG